MNEISDRQAASEDPSVVRVVDGASAFDEIWAAFCDLFGEPTSPARALQAKIVRELAERGATREDVIRRAAAMAALWGPKCVTPASLWKHWGRFAGTISSIDEADVERHQSEERYRRLAGGSEASS